MCVCVVVACVGVRVQCVCVCVCAWWCVVRVVVCSDDTRRTTALNNQYTNGYNTGRDNTTLPGWVKIRPRTNSSSDSNANVATRLQ